jgi:PAS domain S-box-containing protein
MEAGMVSGFGGVRVRRQRSTVWIAAAAALLALLIAILAQWQATGLGTGRWSGLAPLRLALYGLGAVGVVVLGVGAGRLTGVITSIAARLPAEPSGVVPVDRPQELVAAIDAHLARCHQTVEQLQGALSDLQVQSRLSEREKRQTEAILYSLHDAVLVVDGADRLLMANEPAAQLFGFEARQARYQPLAEVMGTPHPEFVELLRQSGRTRTEATKRELLFTQGDRPRTFETILSCVQEDGKVSGVVAVLHDVTKEKEIAQMKNDFVSHVSHELKTPLA